MWRNVYLMRYSGKYVFGSWASTKEVAMRKRVKSWQCVGTMQGHTR